MSDGPYNVETGWHNAGTEGYLGEEDRLLIEAFLKDGGYKSITEWAKDSDYHFNPATDEWRNENGDAMSITECILGAIDACGFGQEEE